MTIDLKGERVLFVGAASGIGRQPPRVSQQMGATIFAAGRTKAAIEAVARSVGGQSIQLDVRATDQVDAMFTERSPFDHVITAAVSTIAGPVAGLALDDAKARDCKFWGAYRIARAAKVDDRGSMTFASGVPSQRPAATAVLQGASNAALEALARGLALERAPIWEQDFSWSHRHSFCMTGWPRMPAMRFTSGRERHWPSDAWGRRGMWRRRSSSSRPMLSSPDRR